MASWFDVTHYGEIIDDYESVLGGKFVRCKTYRYEGNLYDEIKCNGKVVQFKKVQR